MVIVFKDEGRFVSQLKEEVESLEEELSHVTESEERYKKELEALQHRYRLVEEKVNAQKEELAQLTLMKEKEKEAKEKLEKLTLENHQLRETLNHYQHQMSKLEVRQKKLEEAYDQEKETALQLVNEAEQLNEKLKELKSQFEALQIENLHLEKENKRLQHELERIQREKNDDVTALLNEHQESKLQNEKLLKQIGEIDETLRTLKRSNTEEAHSIKELHQDSLKTLRSETNNIHEAIQKLSTNIENSNQNMLTQLVEQKIVNEKSFEQMRNEVCFIKEHSEQVQKQDEKMNQFVQETKHELTHLNQSHEAKWQAMNGKLQQLATDVDVNKVGTALQIEKIKQEQLQHHQQLDQQLEWILSILYHHQDWMNEFQEDMCCHIDEEMNNTIQKLYDPIQTLSLKLNEFQQNQKRVEEQLRSYQKDSVVAVERVNGKLHKQQTELKAVKEENARLKQQLQSLQLFSENYELDISSITEKMDHQNVNIDGKFNQVNEEILYIKDESQKINEKLTTQEQSFLSFQEKVMSMMAQLEEKVKSWFQSLNPYQKSKPTRIVKANQVTRIPPNATTKEENE